MAEVVAVLVMTVVIIVLVLMFMLSVNLHRMPKGGVRMAMAAAHRRVLWTVG